LQAVIFLPLENLTSTVLCDSSEVPAVVMKDKAVVVMRGNCTFLEKARIAQSLGAKMLLIASKARLSPPSDNKTDFENLSLPVALIRYNDITLGNEINVTLYSPPLPEFDCSMVVIFVIAVFTVALGAYWMLQLLTVCITCTFLFAMLFPHCILSLTPISHSFYLVYVIILVFCLASAMSLYNCLAALIGEIPFAQCRYCMPLNSYEVSIEVRLIFLAAFCIAAAAVWAVFRNEDR
uniref:PA domain-containing protein n=1 Tax=Pavo cristatus TaxID=9049 RepID=A0A8C9LFG5_PAVCR